MEKNIFEIELNLNKKILDSFKIKNSLNKEIWSNDKLNSEVRKQIIQIVKDFIGNLKFKKPIKIKDILFTGSLANFNWSEFSDIDVHILIDFNEIDVELNILKDYFDSQKKLWNEKHDIKIYGFPIELYVQDVNEELIASAIYSIQKNEWIKKPKNIKFKINKKLIKNKVNVFLKELKKIEKAFSNKDYLSVLDLVDELKTKIKELRKFGLEKSGELADENLIFKVLRRTNFIDLLNFYSTEAYDRVNSLNEISEKRFLKGGVLFILGEKLENNEKRLFVTTINNISKHGRKKVDNSDGSPVDMVNFNNNDVHRIGIIDGKLKILKVDWRSKKSMLERLALNDFNVGLNSDKTPLHYESLNFKDIQKAINDLKSDIIKLENIRWIN